MRAKSFFRGVGPTLRCAAMLTAGALCAAAALAQAGAPNAASSQEQSATQVPKDQKSSEPRTTKLRLHVTTKEGKPVANASVYVRFNMSGGILRRDKLAEMDFKTNQDGSVKVPDIPQGKILIQVVAKGWHTYGKWFNVEKDEETIAIQLEPPPRWY